LHGGRQAADKFNDIESAAVEVHVYWHG